MGKEERRVLNGKQGVSPLTKVNVARFEIEPAQCQLLRRKSCAASRCGARNGQQGRAAIFQCTPFSARRDLPHTG
eukprot:3265407-Pleurochrysis_carterae.AAC.1